MLNWFGHCRQGAFEKLLQWVHVPLAMHTLRTRSVWQQLPILLVGTRSDEGRERGKVSPTSDPVEVAAARRGRQPVPAAVLKPLQRQH